ncbi:hypothetical protein ACJX0J_031883, partial [Zea mays]
QQLTHGHTTAHDNKQRSNPSISIYGGWADEIIMQDAKVSLLDFHSCCLFFLVFIVHEIRWFTTSAHVYAPTYFTHLLNWQLKILLAARKYYSKTNERLDHQYKIFSSSILRAASQRLG